MTIIENLEAYAVKKALAYMDKSPETNQPWNDNMLRPCPVLDNPGRLTAVVEETGAKSTDYQNLETAEEFSDKCAETAERWAPVADRLWRESRERKETEQVASCAGCSRCTSGNR